MIVCPKLAVQKAITASQKPEGNSNDLFAVVDAITSENFSVMPFGISVSLKTCMDCGDSRCDEEDVVCAYDPDHQIEIQVGAA